MISQKEKDDLVLLSYVRGCTLDGEVAHVVGRLLDFAMENSQVKKGDSMNIRRYVKILINVDETGEYCHKFCGYNSPSFCSLFQQRFDDGFPDYPHNCTHKRLPECIDHELI